MDSSRLRATNPPSRPSSSVGQVRRTPRIIRSDASGAEGQRSDENGETCTVASFGGIGSTVSKCINIVDGLERRSMYACSGVQISRFHNRDVDDNRSYGK